MRGTLERSRKAITSTHELRETISKLNVYGIYLESLIVCQLSFYKKNIRQAQNSPLSH